MANLWQTQEKVKNPSTSPSQRLRLHEPILSQFFQYHLCLMQTRTQRSFHQTPHPRRYQSLRQQTTQITSEQWHQIHQRLHQRYEKNQVHQRNEEKNRSSRNRNTQRSRKSHWSHWRTIRWVLNVQKIHLSSCWKTYQFRKFRRL